MIFFCFSSKDRHSIVESIFFHVTNYHLPVWYDRHQMLLGDDRDYKNFEEGVGRSDYSVVIVTPNSINSVCVKEELELIYDKYTSNDIQVFPIAYNISATNFPEEFKWMRKLVYKELSDSDDSRSACNHIICRFLLDELSKYQIITLNDFIVEYENNPPYSFLIKLVKSYISVSDNNHNSQISLLYAGCLYIRTQYSLKGVPRFYYEGVDRLFGETRLNLEIDLRETLILERLFLLLLNSAIFGYIS